MDNAARTRQRVLAIFLPIAAVLYISAEALSPKGTDQVATDTATALKLLAIAAKHPTQLYIAGTCAVLGLGALAVSYAAIATLTREPRFGPGHRRGADRRHRGLLRSHHQRPGLPQPRRRRHGPHDTRRGRAVPGDNLQLRVRPRVLIRLFHRHLRRTAAHGGGAVAKPEPFRAGWRSCSSSAWKSPKADILRPGSSSCTCCHLRPRWSCWPPGSGRRPRCPPGSHTGAGRRTRVAAFRGLPGRARTDALTGGRSVTRVLFRPRSGPVRFASSSRLDPPPGTEARANTEGDERMSTPANHTTRAAPRAGAHPGQLGLPALSAASGPRGSNAHGQHSAQDGTTRWRPCPFRNLGSGTGRQDAASGHRVCG